MAYNSMYQPNMDRNEFQRIGMQAGKNILEKTIIYGAQAIKFIVQFTMDAIRSVIGK